MRFQVIGMVLLAAATLSLMGQQKNAPPATGRIEGTVVDGVSNQPITGLTVTALQEKDRRNITTDAQGRFSFTLPHGTVRLLTSKDGYAALRPEGHRFPTDGVLLAVAPSQQLRGLKLRVFQTGVVTGIVYDSKVKPVQYARAQLLRYWYDEDGERALRPVATGKGGETNDHGEFRIDGVDPGEYLLQMTPPILAEREPGEPFVQTRPAPLTVKSGSETHVDDTTLPSVRGGSIRIHLVNQTGEPIQNTLNKYLRWTSSETPPTAVIIPLLIMGGPERAEIPAVPGTYEVVAGWSRGNAAPIGVGRKTVEVGRNTVNLELTVTKGTPLAVRAAPGVRCEFSNSVFGNVSATAAADGLMTLDNVQPAVYRVNCSSLPVDNYIAEIKQGDRDVLKDGLQVNANGDNNAVVTLSSVAGTAEGSVTDAKGIKVAGALVAVVPETREARQFYRTTATDQNGAFSIRAIAPGAYRVYAWDELEGAAYKNAEFMKKYEMEGSPLKVEKGGKATVTVKLLQE